jgi:hypothetical protein
MFLIILVDKFRMDTSMVIETVKGEKLGLLVLLVSHADVKLMDNCIF